MNNMFEKLIHFSDKFYNMFGIKSEVKYDRCSTMKVDKKAIYMVKYNWEIVTK